MKFFFSVYYRSGHIIDNEPSKVLFVYISAFSPHPGNEFDRTNPSTVPAKFMISEVFLRLN